jgi:hypothetical protein
MRFLISEPAFVLSERFSVFVWRGISRGWEPASSLRSRSDAERFCSLLKKVRGDQNVYKVEAFS